MNQYTMPGIHPHDTDTAWGRLTCGLAARFGWAWVWKRAHWLAYGEGLAVRGERREAA